MYLIQRSKGYIISPALPRPERLIPLTKDSLIDLIDLIPEPCLSGREML